MVYKEMIFLLAIGVMLNMPHKHKFYPDFYYEKGRKVFGCSICYKTFTDTTFAGRCLK